MNKIFFITIILNCGAKVQQFPQLSVTQFTAFFTQFAEKALFSPFFHRYMSGRRPREDQETKNRTNCIIYLHNSKKSCTFATDFTFQIVKKYDFGKYCPHAYRNMTTKVSKSSIWQSGCLERSKQKGDNSTAVQRHLAEHRHQPQGEACPLYRPPHPKRQNFRLCLCAAIGDGAVQRLRHVPLGCE